MSNAIFLSELLSTRLPYSCCHLHEQDNGGFQNLEQELQNLEKCLKSKNSSSLSKV